MNCTSAPPPFCVNPRYWIAPSGSWKLALPAGVVTSIDFPPLTAPPSIYILETLCVFTFQILTSTTWCQRPSVTPSAKISTRSDVLKPNCPVLLIQPQYMSPSPPLSRAKIDGLVQVWFAVLPRCVV